MTTNHEVLCINKSNRTDPHERITHIGGRSSDGTKWKLEQQEAIRGIESGKWAFYVNKDKKLVDVIVATSVYGNKYLKTTADGVHPNNLLSLPECF